MWKLSPVSILWTLGHAAASAQGISHRLHAPFEHQALETVSHKHLRGEVHGYRAQGASCFDVTGIAMELFAHGIRTYRAVGMTIRYKGAGVLLEDPAMYVAKC